MKSTTLIKILLTTAIIGCAAYLIYLKYQDYFTNPWTRDGQIRTQVIQIAPRVTGHIVKIYVKDNQYVKAGDLLFEIDSTPFKINLSKAQTDLKRAKIKSRGYKIEYDRVRKIAKRDRGAISQKDLIKHEINYLDSLEKIDIAKEKINQAKLNIKYTKVKASVDGYVSNINFQIGTQAVANKPLLALVDINSFWVFGFFRETMLKDLKIGDKAIVTLMAYPDTPLKGYVESIGWGIAYNDGKPGSNLLPQINPVFEWIRLAQRIPVKVKFDKLPDNIKLRVGLTASVMVMKNTHKK
jgi:multidrug resistance efflux pump